MLLADLLRTNQRYFEIEREAQERAQEIATNVKTEFETFVFKHLCIHTAKQMVKEYLKSTKYTDRLQVTCIPVIACACVTR